MRPVSSLSRFAGLAAGLILLVGSVRAQEQTFVGFDVQNIIIAPIFIDFGSPQPGELVESRITVDMTVDPFADVRTMEFLLAVPHDDGDDTPQIVTEVIPSSVFTLTGDNLSGTYTTTAVNGETFWRPDSIGGWSLQIRSTDGSFTIWGEGDVRGEFDLIPEPATGMSLLAALALAVRRRR